MAVEYEWDVETQSDRDTADYEEDEVIDHAHQKTYAECIAFTRHTSLPEGMKFAIVLVRDDDDERSWAYVGEQGLPMRFTNANGIDRALVPMRFSKEWERQHPRHD